MKCSLSTKKPTILILLLFSFSVQIVLAQNFSSRRISELDSLIFFSQNYYGINDELVNGFVYALPDPMIEGHPYLNENWVEGKLFIHGKVFQNIPVKYDLVQDEMVIKVKNTENTERIIAMSKKQVDSLVLNNALFVNSRILTEENSGPSFYEVVFPGQLSLVKKYEKRFIGLYNSSTPRGKFSDLNSGIMLFNGKQFVPVDSKKSFIRYFGDSRKKEITHYFRENKINYRKATSAQLVDLMQFCTQNLQQ
jgi:hypothetical protein